MVTKLSHVRISIVFSSNLSPPPKKKRLQDDFDLFFCGETRLTLIKGSSPLSNFYTPQQWKTSFADLPSFQCFFKKKKKTEKEEKKTTSADAVEAPACSTRSATQHIRSSAPAAERVFLSNWAGKLDGCKRERDRRQERWGRRCERSRRLTLTLSCLCSLHGWEVSPAPSLPRMLMQPPLPGNRLLGVAQGLGTRNICDRGHDEGPKGLLWVVCFWTHFPFLSSVKRSDWSAFQRVCVCVWKGSAFSQVMYFHRMAGNTRSPPSYLPFTHLHFSILRRSRAHLTPETSVTVTWQRNRYTDQTQVTCRTFAAQSDSRTDHPLSSPGPHVSFPPPTPNPQPKGRTDVFGVSTLRCAAKFLIKKVVSGLIFITLEKMRATPPY